MEQKTSISDAIRYVLIGFVGFFYFSFLYPEPSAKVIKDIGAIPLTGCAMAGGAVFFFLYDAFILPAIHRLKDELGTSEVSYRVRLKKMFPEYNLTSAEAEYLYVSVLRNRFGWKDVPDLAVLTSGIHLLYMSALLAFLFMAIAFKLGNCTKVVEFLVIFTVTAIAGFLQDRRAERMETALLFDADKESLRPAVVNAFPTRASRGASISRSDSSTSADNVERMTLEYLVKRVALEYLRTAPLSEIGPHLRVVADRIDEHRRANRGFTPRELFVHCLEIGLSYACIELVLWVRDDSGGVNGVALKRRDTGDQGWQGKLTITGVAVRPFDSLKQAQEQLLDEITSYEDMKSLLRQAFSASVFIEVHREDTDTQVEGRRANCLTAVYAKVINQSDISKLATGFEVVPLSRTGDSAIVDHHRETLKALHGLNGGGAA